MYTQPRIALFVSLISAFALAHSASASLVLHQWKIEDGGNGNFYGQVFTPSITREWADSKLDAESHVFLGTRGHLATITSLGEQLFIEDFYDGQKSWIGLTDDPAFGGSESSLLPDPTKDGWVWVTGEAVSFTNWFAVGEPNGSGNFVTMGRGVKEGGWNDDFGHLESYIIEFEAVPEPGSFLVWLVVLVVGIGCWKLRANRITTNFNCP